MNNTSRTWAEINLGALEDNYKYFRRKIAENVKFMAVIKADAYGHGAIDVARKLMTLGADMFAVSCVSECLELRNDGINLPILCLGQRDYTAVADFLEHDIRATVCDLKTAREFAKIAKSSGKKLKVHIKINTGMNRLGFSCDEIEELKAQIEEIHSLGDLEIEGVFTHFSMADEDEGYTRAQLGKFLELKMAISHLKIPIFHCSNTAGTLLGEEFHLDMVRVGLGLYGYYSSENPPKNSELRPVMTLKCKVCAVNGLREGEKISYGGSATMEKDGKVAVLPIGYADGFARTLSNRASVAINGKSFPVIGRICMDMTILRVDGSVNQGDVAIIFGENREGYILAKQANTIVYEILTSIGKRVPRVLCE